MSKLSSKLFKSLIIFFLAFSALSQDYQVTLVARECPEYTDVMANRARNNIMESLRDLGPNSIYTGSQAVSKSIEDQIPTQITNCIPLNDWKFAIGEGISGSKDIGFYGELSKVSNFKRVTPVTKNNVVVRDSNGNPTGNFVDGAVTITLSASEVAIMKRNRLTVQGGQPGNPLLSSAVLGFGSLRCGIDNQNADNVEYAKFPSSAEHIFCYAYYINPAPTAAKIIITKTVENSTNNNVQFSFGGNTSFNSGGTFKLRNSESIDFDRAAVSSGDPEWIVSEDLTAMPAGYAFSRIECTSDLGSVSTITSNQVSINLQAGDTVRCNFINRETPNVSPILECTARSAVSSYTAHFGYLNRGNSIATVPPGSSNRFTPAPENRGQPYTFQVGRQAQVFAEEHSGGPLTWSLTGRTATSSSSSAQRCLPTCIVPTSITVGQCDPSILIDGSLSGTLNNNGILSDVKWTTTCPGTLSNTNTLKPNLAINYSNVPAGGTNCLVTATVTDDTRYGSSDPAELQTRSCSTEIEIPRCRVDCAGIPNGNTEIDACGVCGGDGNSCLDCAGVPNGGAVIDLCGVCSGENESCSDCAGIPLGGAVEDACGVCGGDGTSCLPGGCSGDLDACGVCGGDGSTCKDCAGIPNGKTEIDECGICGGDGSSCSVCIEEKPVDSNDSKNLRKISRDLVLLGKNAGRYVTEARTCAPSSAASLDRKIDEILDLLKAINSIVKDDLNTINNQCSNSQCAEVSIEIIKVELKLLAKKLRSLTRSAQLIVAKCRKPIKSNSRARDSRQLLADIVAGVNKLDDTAIACTPG